MDYSDNFDDNFSKLFKEFNKNGIFNKENFRLFVLKKLYSIYTKLNFYTKSEKYKSYWQRAKDWSLVNQKYDSYKEGFERVNNLDKSLENWIRDSVKSKEGFEFFILSKASEINSGDITSDYYLAQMIRQDQLWSVVLIYLEALKYLMKCVKYEKSELVGSKEFKFFMEKELEERVFETALRIYGMRTGL